MNGDDEPVRSVLVWITACKDSECLAGKQSGLRKIIMGPRKYDYVLRRSGIAFVVF